MSNKDPVRTLAFRVLRAISAEGAYANLELGKQLAATRFNSRDAAFVTELVAGTCRLQGTYDLIIAQATGRKLKQLQPAVIDVLRLAAHQLLSMRVPAHAAVSSSVELAVSQIGDRTRGLINAAARRIGERTLTEWLDLLSTGLDELGELALRSHHPRWIVEAWSHRLPKAELPAALAADNQAPEVHLAVRPGLLAVSDLYDVEPAIYSPFGAYLQRPPGVYQAIQDGLAGVQDEGSQLVTWALSRVETPAGPWLDLCAGPGGKAALLAGLAIEQGTSLLAAELQPHRARLVQQALRAYSGPLRPTVITADGTWPCWEKARFARVLLDAPCTGLGALRRRPESRWRRSETDLDKLVTLQKRLLASAIESTMPGGVIAYVTCSPHLPETHQVIETVGNNVELLHAADYLAEVPGVADGDFVQLWPHRHGTDAMFLALLRKLHF